MIKCTNGYKPRRILLRESKTFNYMKNLKWLFTACILFSTCWQPSLAQTEVEAWGNLKGIRVNGQLINFQSNIYLLSADSSATQATAKEAQRPGFNRQGNKQLITTRLDSMYITETFEDVGTGKANVVVRFRSAKDTLLAGLYFHLQLPVADYENAAITYGNHKKLPNNQGVTASSVKIAGLNKQLELAFDKPATITQASKGQYIHFYIPLHTGSFSTGQTGALAFTITASGSIDTTAVTVQLDASKPGRVFAGFGGNFRLQNPKFDPAVIDYCLNNMRVAWGRVEMPWRLWQPDENSDPLNAAKAGNLHPHVRESMEMAQRLSKMNIPVILSAWFPPQWAVTGKLQLQKQPEEAWGNPLNQEKSQLIYKSIADYVQYLQTAYGVTVQLFSFNESDLGINVRQTGEEHAKLIRELGAVFKERGLPTKMLLGDNSDANTYSFLQPAMDDASTHPYIGAVSFHSWRGWDDTTLQKWAGAASTLQLPLFIGEGSIDAAAWAYPQIFDEPVYAMEEINLYVRLLNICQPVSILQWQLTSDYSPLRGGGMFGNTGPLQPTQRFWNLKQLASIPANVAAIPATSGNTGVTVAAQMDASNNAFVVHLVNNGAGRTVTIRGLPVTVKQLAVHTTSATKQMQAENAVAVANGEATVWLDAASYTTLVQE